MRDLFFDRVFRSKRTSANYRMGMANAKLFLISNLIPVIPAPVYLGEAPSSPPYATMWFEWQFTDGNDYGALVVSERLVGDGWAVVIFPALVVEQTPAEIPLGFRFKLDSSGRSATPDRGLEVNTGVGTNGTMIGNEAKAEALLPLILPPIIFALTLLHCKNVNPVEMGGPSMQRGGQSSRSQLRRHHVLQVRPMGGGKQVRSIGQPPSAESTKTSLHFVRGHFKTYTDDAPLFGRLTGSYWWESHARGDVSVGIVTKDYSVNPPLSNGETP